MKRLCLPLILASASGMSGSALGDVINFESFPTGTAVTTQYPMATFSSQVDRENRIAFDFDFGTGQYIITAAVGGAVDGVNSTIIDFTSPVNNLSFLALGDNSAGIQAMVDVYENGVFSSAEMIAVDGIFLSPDLVSLSGFANVTKIEIWGITDPGGLAWDQFSFDPIPSPSGAVVLAFGICMNRRRRR
jgi:hypothetical protein